MNPNDTDRTLDRLVELLDLVVREQVGESLADTMQRIRRLAVERRAGIPDAEPRLVNERQRLAPAEMRAVIRWLSFFFELANLAEERQRIDVLDQRMQATAMSILGARGELLPHAPLATGVGDWLDSFLFAQSGPIYAGTNEIQRLVIGRHMVKEAFGSA